MIPGQVLHCPEHDSKAGVGFFPGREQETLCRKEEDSCVHYMMEGNGYIEKNNQKEDWFAEFFLPDHIRLRCVIFCIVQ